MSIPEFANRASEIEKTAQKIGVTTDALQRYRYAAAQADVDTGALNMAFQKTAQGLGSGSLVKSLEKIDKGLANHVKNAKSTEEAFLMIATAARKTTNVVARTNLLMTAFGKSGNQLVPMLGDLEEQLKAAGKFGNIISPQDLRLATQFGDKLTDLKLASQAFGDIIRANVVRHIFPLVERFREWAATNREIIATKIKEYIATAANFISRTATILSTVLKVLSRIRPIVVAVTASLLVFRTVTNVTRAANLAMQAYNATMATSAIVTKSVGASAVSAGVSAKSATAAFGGLVKAILASKLAMAGLVGAAIGGIMLLIQYSNRKWTEHKAAEAEKLGISAEGYDRALKLANEDWLNHSAIVGQKQYELNALSHQWHTEPNPATRAAFDTSIRKNRLWLDENEHITMGDFQERRFREIKEQEEKEDSMKEVNDNLQKVLAELGAIDDSINVLADNGPNSPARLRHDWAINGRIIQCEC
jgi:hypothetical protein